VAAYTGWAQCFWQYWLQGQLTSGRAAWDIGDAIGRDRHREASQRLSVDMDKKTVGSKKQSCIGFAVGIVSHSDQRYESAMSRFSSVPHSIICCLDAGDVTIARSRHRLNAKWQGGLNLEDRRPVRNLRIPGCRFPRSPGLHPAARTGGPRRSGAGSQRYRPIKTASTSVVQFYATPKPLALRNANAPPRCIPLLPTSNLQLLFARSCEPSPVRLHSGLCAVVHLKSQTNIG